MFQQVRGEAFAHAAEHQGVQAAVRVGVPPGEVRDDRSGQRGRVLDGVPHEFGGEAQENGGCGEGLGVRRVACLAAEHAGGLQNLPGTVDAQREFPSASPHAVGAHAAYRDDEQRVGGVTRAENGVAPPEGHDLRGACQSCQRVPVGTLEQGCPGQQGQRVRNGHGLMLPRRLDTGTGQRKNSRFRAVDAACPAGTSESWKIAPTGHAAAHAPQSMHSSGWITNWSPASWMHSIGQTWVQAASFTPAQPVVIT